MTTALFKSINQWLCALLLLAVLFAQAGCGYVAAGAVGAAVGHEVAERDHDDED